MNELKQPIIEGLRVSRRAGATIVQLLTSLEPLAQPDLMRNLYFQAAFELSSDAVGAISGWFPDGSGELDDDEIEALLGPAVDAAMGRLE